MPDNPAYFVGLFRDLLLKNHLTPTRVANLVGVRTETVEAWLSGQLPRAVSVWTVGQTLNADQRALLSSAVAHFHARQIARLPENIDVRFDKSASAYLSGTLESLPAKDRQRFLQTWQSILEENNRPLPLPEEEPLASELILLPRPTIAVIDEWGAIIDEIARDASQLYQLHWKRFEDLIARLLERYGWKIEQMGYTKDNGTDIVAVTRVTPDIRFTMMVQCKRLAQRRKVGIATVREVWSVKWHQGLDRAMIATTSTFTRGAKEQGEQWALELKDHDAIVQWCKGLRSSNATLPTSIVPKQQS